MSSNVSPFVSGRQMRTNGILSRVQHMKNQKTPYSPIFITISGKLRTTIKIQRELKEKMIELRMERYRVGRSSPIIIKGTFEIPLE